ncbi:hypothetical protein IMCC3317_07070 [Kordia antarctica]|uniref:4-fold beta flower domain-containing protein n=1 Tax=Kordia antarctica TaxID=1218801 RepID=A0A7L4ZFY7_9FLAO|nr:hypothetical protein [Kordia antarctica]QHI35361.1 hypothetical protein IMCC3317_07070 [Kordia antarctica]
MKKIIFLLLIASLLSLKSTAQEISLFDKNGDPIAYIATKEEMAIYLWDGTPVAYLDAENDEELYDIYGFNGNHLGWYDDGFVINHKGYIVGFVKSATNIFTRYEPFKPFKKFKPFKGFKKFPPFKPFFRDQFSTESFAIFLLRGKK